MRTGSLRLISSLALAGAIAAAALPSSIAAGKERDHAGAAPTRRAAALVSRMTQDEKMALIRGEPEPYPSNQGQPGFLKGVPRFNIPPMRLADGPPGVLTRVPSSAFTATMGLAATFSREDARLNGLAIGAEANRLSIDVVLQPFINIDRDITFMRAYNTLGEDPLLSGTLGASMIRGIQSRGVMAQAKHYIGFESNNRDDEIDMQALHEVYLAPFEQAIDAGVSSVMCSYNRINGPYACGNKELLVDVLRGELRFDGFVTSDWGAVHDNDYLAKGLDMEMAGRVDPDSALKFVTRTYFETEPQAAYPPPDMKKLGSMVQVTGDIPEEVDAQKAVAGEMGGGFGAGEKMTFTMGNDYKTLFHALKDGTVTEAMIDQAATRVLAQIIRFGYLDGSRARLLTSAPPIDVPDIIRRTGADAAVLLKNEGGILPLATTGSGQTVLIGPTARQVAAIGRSGERSIGLVDRQVGPFDALRAAMPKADLRLEVGYDMNGQPVPASALTHGERVAGLSHSAGGTSVGVDAQVDFTGTRALPANSDHAWEGALTVPSAGAYVFGVHTLGARGVLRIDGKVVIGTNGRKYGLHGDIVHPNTDDLLPTLDGLNSARGAVTLTAGAHSIRYETIADGSDRPVQVRLNWVTPEAQAANRAAAIAAARKARTAVVFAWSRDTPKFLLPADQDAFIAEVAAANPNTVVVLNTSQPVAMPWIDKVKSVVQMWWPGDEGGLATADILSGRKNPAGRLPVTWAARLQDYSANDPAYPERQGNAGTSRAIYSEGVDVGYRWFDRTRKAPLYPFGHGLSYTRFDYSDLSVTHAKHDGYDVRFTVRNAGDKDGEEVSQVYVSAPARPMPGVQFAVNALAGFDRIFVPAGRSKTVTVHLDPRRTQYWSTTDRKWVPAASGRTVSVGASSRDLRLHARLP